MRWGDPGVTVVLAAAWFGLLTALWAGLRVAIPRWAVRWRLDPTGRPASRPLVSICLAVRDEERRLPATLERILAVDWPALEVVVVDDQSSDGTLELLRRGAAAEGRLRVVEGTPPPPGWSGRAWAQQRAAGEARGELLLFIDADVHLAPWSVAAAVAALEGAGASWVSIIGRWELRSPWAWLVVPLASWFERTVVSVPDVNEPSKPDGWADGHFLLVRAEDYAAVEGHRGVRGALLDTAELARVLKRRARRGLLLYGLGAYAVEARSSLASLWDGWTRRLYPALGRRPGRVGGMVLFLTTCTLLPFALVPVLAWLRWGQGWEVVGPAWVVWAAVVSGLVGATFVKLEHMEGRRGWLALALPVSALVLVAMLLASANRYQVLFKGRVFVDGEVPRQASD